MKHLLLQRTEDGRRKAAQIIGNARIGGVVSCVLNYYKFMDRSRWRFDFFVYEHCDFDEAVRAVDPDARVLTIPRLDRDPLGAMRALKRQLTEGGYAVAHAHMTTLSAFALRAAKKAGVPVRVCHAHSTFDKNSDHYRVKALLRPFAARDATHLMACGRKAAENLYRGRAEEAYILPNAIDASRFSPPPGAAHGPAPVREVLFVGRFAYQKNLQFLLRAFARARKEREMRLTLVGGGGEEKALRALSGALGIEASVRFVPPCDPLPYYGEADLFCLPSRYEGLPVVGLEAQAAGLPCLFADNVDRDADVCGGNEFLPLDEGAWARAMLAPRAKSADNCTKLRERHFDIRAEAGRLPAFYGQALRGIL